MMKLFLQYIKKFRGNFVFLVLGSLVFVAVFALYQLEIEAVFYAFLICFVARAVCVLIGFLKFRKQHQLLRKIYDALPLMIEEIPEPDTLTERDLFDIILKLSDINQHNLNTMRNLQRDNMEYFTVWVHQIKTPISAMQMILQDEDTESNRELSAELFRIEQYAEMALHFIRLDSSSNDFVIRRYDLDQIIRQAVRRYAPLLIRRKIHLVYSPVNAAVLTDEKWLLFILEQLLSNAVKYTYSGTVEICYYDEMLTVSDTGIGIPAEDLPRIFEKGYTGLSGRTNQKSTGLGLYLCKKVCDKLGHQIFVKSQPGKGSVFFVDLRTENFQIE